MLNAAGEPQMVPTPTSPGTEAHKTEPDKNTYVVFKDSLPGADPHYYYGTHFLFPGHETGVPGYITRINHDADAAHRVTLLATKDVTGANIADIDGSTWDPWARRLLFTTENAGAPTYSATPGYPSTVTDISGALGRGVTRASRMTATGTSGSPKTRAGRTRAPGPLRCRTASSTATSPRPRATSRTASWRCCRS